MAQMLAKARAGMTPKQAFLSIVKPKTTTKTTSTSSTAKASSGSKPTVQEMMTTSPIMQKFIPSKVHRAIIKSRDRKKDTGKVDTKPTTQDLMRMSHTSPIMAKVLSPDVHRAILKAKERKDSKKDKVDTKPKDEFPDTKVSPYLKKFGYTPVDYDYHSILSDIESQKVSKDELKNILIGTFKGKSYARQMSGNLKTVLASAEDSTWDVGRDEPVSRAEAISILESGIEQNLKASQGMKQLPSIIRHQKLLGEQEKMVRDYRSKGYEVDITDKGYQFKIPKASKVHSWYVGDPEKEKALLSSASFMESPLAIGTLMDVGAGALTGDKGFQERRHEKLAKFSLGLQESLKDSDYVGYAGKVVSSPAMIQGVYIPAVTLGAGYAITGISAGASGVAGSTASVLGRIGARGGTTLARGLRLGSGAVGGGLMTVGAVGIGRAVTSGGIDKYDLPSLTGEMGFSFGMAYGGYKTGQKMWTQKHTGSWKYDFKTNKMKWSDKNIKSQDIIGTQNIVEQPGSKGIKHFTGEGQQIIGGKKVDVLTHGRQVPVKGSGGKMAYAEGTARLTQTTHMPKYQIRGIKLGTIRQTTHFHRFQNLGKLIGQKGKMSLSVSVGESTPGLSKVGGAKPMPDWIKTKSLFGKEKIVYDTPTGNLIGGKTTSKGLTLTTDTGKFKFEVGRAGDKPVYLEDITVSKPSTMFPGETIQHSVGIPKQSLFAHFGKYLSPHGSGRITQIGRIFSFGKTKATGSVGGGSASGLPSGSMPGGGGTKGLSSVLKLGLDSSGQGSVMKLGGGSPSIHVGTGGVAEGLTSQGSKQGLASLLKMGGDTGQASKMFDYGSVLESIGAKSASVFGTPAVSGSPSLLGGGLSLGASLAHPTLTLVKPAQSIQMDASKQDRINIINPSKPGGLSVVSVLGSVGGGSAKKAITVGSAIGKGSLVKQRGRQVLIQPLHIGAELFKSKKVELVSVGHDLLSKGKQIQLGKSLLKPLIVTIPDPKTDVFKESEPVVAVAHVFDTAQAQAQQQKQASALQLKLFSPTLTITEPVIHPVNVFTPKPVLPIVLPLGGRGRVDKGGMGLLGLYGRKKKGKRTLVKTVLADPFMVQLSQVKFGKATHIIPDKEIWKMGEKTWWRIPTKELMEKGTGNKNTKISLNVFRR